MSAEDRELEVAKSLGTLEAQVRELIHNDGARAQQDIATGRILGKLEGMPEQIAQMETRLNARLVTLENANLERNTREGVMAAIIRSPMTLWVVSIAGLIWAYLAGKIHLDG